MNAKKWINDRNMAMTLARQRHGGVEGYDWYSLPVTEQIDWTRTASLARQLMAEDQPQCCWVKTSERLPTKEKEYLCIFDNSSKAFPALFCVDPSGRAIWIRKGSRSYGSPDLWLDYPDPPSVEEKNCSYCGKPGHWRPDCDALAEDVRFDKWWRDQSAGFSGDYGKHWARVGWKASKGGE